MPKQRKMLIMDQCVFVWGGGGYNIKEGKGRLKSWTLCDGLGEGVKG